MSLPNGEAWLGIKRERERERERERDCKYGYRCVQKHTLIIVSVSSEGIILIMWLVYR